MAGSRRAYTEPRKSFFQSLDPEERAALLKVAPSLKGKFEQQESGDIRRIILPGDSSDDEHNSMITPMSHPSLQRGVLRSGPPMGAAGAGGGSSDLSDDVDDTPITRRTRNTPRSGGGGEGGSHSAGGFRSNAHVAAAAAGVSPTPYTAAAAAMHRSGQTLRRARQDAGDPGVTSGAAGVVSASRRSAPRASASASARDRDRPPSGIAARGVRGGFTTGVGAAAPFDRVATRDMAARESSLRFEVERLRVQAVSLAAENDGMRAQMDAMRRLYAESEGSFVLQSHELDKLREKALGEGAARAAELEDQCDRQRRMLQELAVASEALARDNVLLSSELVALRDRGEEAEAKVALLTERLTSAQKLYLAGQRSLERAEEMQTSSRDTQWERRLEELLTPEILTKSRPPASYPVPDSVLLAMIPRLDNNGNGARGGAAGGIDAAGGGMGSQKLVPGGLFQERQKLHEQVTSLRRQLDKANRRVGELEDEKTKMLTSAAETRKGAAALSNRQQQQLTGALRRLQWLVERTAQLEADVAEKDEYVASLERRLLTQHKLTQHMTGLVSRRGGGAGAGGGGGNYSFKGTKGAGGGAAAGSRGGSGKVATAGADGVPAPARVNNHTKAAAAAAGRGGGGSWLTGADGRTPAAREALGLARRAMLEVEPGNSFRSTVSGQMSEDEDSEEEQDGGGGGGDYGERGASHGTHFDDYREEDDSESDDDEDPTPAPAPAVTSGGGKLEMSIEISDDDSDDDYGGKRRGRTDRGGGEGSTAKKKKQQPPPWGANKPARAAPNSPQVLRESTSRVLDKILRFEPSGQSRRPGAAASPTVSTPGGGVGGIDGEDVVGAPPVAPSQDDLSLEGIQDYISQLQALHNKSEMLATADPDKR